MAGAKSNTPPVKTSVKTGGTNVSVPLTRQCPPSGGKQK